MAYLPVKSGGTRTTGNEATLPTTSFATHGAANYYDNVNAAMGQAVSGDVIIVSDVHSHLYSSNTVITAPNTGAHIWIVSVSDSAMNQYSRGCYEEGTGGNTDLSYSGRIVLMGVESFATDDTSLIYDIIAIDSDIGSGASSDLVTSWIDGSSIVFRDSTLRLNSVSTDISFRGGAAFYMYGGNVVSGGQLIQGNFTNGGGTAQFYGVDLSTVTEYLVQTVGSDTQADDIVNLGFYGCRLSASLTGFADEDFMCQNQRLVVRNCAATSDAAEYQFYERAYGGEVEDQDDAGIHRSESTAFPGGEKVSAKVTTNAHATQMAPFSFDLITANADLSNASSDVITIYFASTTTLDSHDVWAELHYPDGTNKHTYNYLSNKTVDPFATPSAHTDDSGSSTWKNGVSDLVGYNEYRMTLDTSSDAGADCVPIIRIYCGVASATIYFDTSLGLS